MVVRRYTCAQFTIGLVVQEASALPSQRCRRARRKRSARTPTTVPCALACCWHTVCPGAVQQQVKLNARQMLVLQRIDSGPDPVTSQQPELAVTVYALRNRGLATTSRGDEGWTAEITDAGRFYLTHRRYPEPSADGQMAGRTTSTKPKPMSEASDTSPGRRRGSSLTAGLIKRLQDNGGMLRIEDPDAQTRASYRRAIHSLKQHTLVPEGFHLRHTGRASGDLIIQLADTTNLDDTGWNRIRLGVRDSVTDPSALTGMLRSTPGVIAVSEPAMPRALALVESLARYARRRGHKLMMSRKRPHQGLHLVIREGRCPITITEEQIQVLPHPAADRHPAQGPAPLRPTGSEHEPVTSGCLQLRLPESMHARRTHWMDSGRSRLENKLLDVVKEIEHRVAAEEEFRLAARRRHDERLAAYEQRRAQERAQWDAAMHHAQALAVEHHRTEAFHKAMNSWRAAAQIRAFCDALELPATQPPDVMDTGNLRQWIDWGRSAADTMDPTRNPSQLANVPFAIDPSPDDLRAYLEAERPLRTTAGQ